MDDGERITILQPPPLAVASCLPYIDGMTEAVPRSWFSRTIDFFEGGQPIAVLEHAVLRSSRIVVGEDVYTIRWRGVLRRSYVLEGETRLLAEATATLIPPRCEVMAGDRNLTLRGVGLARRTFRVFHGDLEIGTIRRRSLFRRDVAVDLPDSLPVPIRVFLAFLVYRFWRRRARAAG